MNTSFRRALLVAPTASALTLCGFTGALATDLPAHAAVPAATTATAPVSLPSTLGPAAGSGNNNGTHNAHGIVPDAVPSMVPAVVPGNPGPGNGGQGNGGVIPGVVPAVVPAVVPDNSGVVPGVVPAVAPTVVPGNAGQGNGGSTPADAGHDKGGVVPSKGRDGNGTHGNGGQGSDGAIPGNNHDGAMPDSGNGHGTHGHGGQGTDSVVPGVEDEDDVDTAAPEPANKNDHGDVPAPEPESPEPSAGQPSAEETPAPGSTTPVVHVLAPQAPRPVGVTGLPHPAVLMDEQDFVFASGPAVPVAAAEAVSVATGPSLASGVEMSTTTVPGAAVRVSVAGEPVSPSALPDSLAYTGVGNGVLGAGGLGALLLALGAALRLRRG